MYKKVMLILLVLTIALTSFSGCGNSNGSVVNSEDPAEVTSDPSAQMPSPTVEIAENTAPVVSVAEDASVADAQIQEPVSTIEYPIANGDVTLSIWKAFDSGYSAFFNSYNDLECKSLVEEATGVNLEIVEVSESVAAEQFNLMAASNSWTDLVSVNMYYSGGVDGAYADGIIYDLTDYIEEYMPDYWAIYKNLNDATKKSLTADGGRILKLATLSESAQQAQGLAMRKDWLDELSLDIPETIDEFTEVMRAFKNAYDTDYTIYVDKTGVVNHVYGAFGSNAFGVSASFFGGSTLGFYQKDDICYSALQSDGYRAYLEWFIEMYSEGLINSDFYITSMSSAEDEEIESGGQTGAFHVRAEKFSVLTELSDDENYELIGVAPIVGSSGETYEFSDALTQTGRNDINITTACENLEIAMKFLNYFFTDEGFIIYNYGIEGTSFNYNTVGEPEYTALITEDSNANQMVVKYTFNILVGAEDATALYGAYWQSELDAMTLWTETMGSDCTMPSVSLTTDESSEYSAIADDLITYAQEYVLRFITGDLELNDENWDIFQNKLADMDIDRCVAIYQAALDRYNA